MVRIVFVDGARAAEPSAIGAIISQMKVIVCIPTYNERDSIAETIRGIFDLNREELSVIVIDDNSPDVTSDIVQEISRFHPYRVMLIKRDRKLGLGSEYIRGFKRAMELGAELIVEMDADGSHDPQDLPAVIDSTSGVVDLVVGSR